MSPRQKLQQSQESIGISEEMDFEVSFFSIRWHASLKHDSNFFVTHCIIKLNASLPFTGFAANRDATGITTDANYDTNAGNIDTP